MRWVIAGGGTGGHLFPGLAIAEAFVERELGNEVLFIGTERGIETQVLAGGKFPLRTIQARPLKGKSLLGKCKAIWSIPMAVSEASSILKDFQPQLVLGVGGYASGPTLLAAFFLKMKRAIHEQNVVPGMTNRILKWFSQRIFVSFEETKKYFPVKKTIVTGTPIRREIIACLPCLPDRQAVDREEVKERKGDRFTPYSEMTAFQVGDEGLMKTCSLKKSPALGRGAGFTLLIFGGSAGAHRINVAIMESLDQLQEIKSSLKFIHQTGRDDIEFVTKGYQEKGFEALVRPFFEEMATYYQTSDLVICRSGASTIAELAVCGKAAILIPYPYAAHNHQFLNAKQLVELGGAVMIRDEELNGPLLAQTILHLYGRPKERARMEEAIQRLGRPRSAEEIVNHCYALVEKVISNGEAS